MNSETWYTEGKKEKINGLGVFYKRSGKGPVLLCIHGFPSSSWDFEPIWPSLIERFDVLIPDLIGLGKSAKPNQKLTIRLQADILEGIAVKGGITEAHLLAHDLGDTIAQELLARQLENTSKVKWLSCVFLNGGLFPETHRALPIQKLLLSKLGPFVSIWMTEKSLKKSMTGIFSKAHPPSDAFIHETWNLITENKGKTMIPKLIHYMSERKTNRERWVQPLVQNVVPLRLINGSKDPISGRHAAQRYAELVPNANVVYLENSGHYPHVETPQEVLHAFFAFHNTL